MTGNITQGPIFTCISNGSKGTLYLDGAAVYTLQRSYAHKLARTLKDRSVLADKNAWLRLRTDRLGPQPRSWAEIGVEPDTFVVVPTEDGEALYDVLVSRGTGRHVKTVMDDRYIMAKDYLFARTVHLPFLQDYWITGTGHRTLYRAQPLYRSFVFRHGAYDDGGNAIYRRGGDTAEWADLRLKQLKGCESSPKLAANIMEVFERLRIKYPSDAIKNGVPRE